MAIGTSSVKADRLEVNGAIRATGTATGYNNGTQITMDYNNGSARINATDPTTSTATLSLLTNGGTRVFMNATGNVGVGGTVTPGSILDIQGPGSSTQFLRAEASGGFNFLVFSTDAGNSPTLFISNPSSLKAIALNPDGTSYFQSTSVGIGSTFPSNKLDVVGAVGVRTANVGLGKVLTDTTGNGDADWRYPAYAP